MALAMQQLLRLPPTLRCEVLTNASFLSRPLETHQSHIRSTFKRNYAQAKVPPKPRRKAPAFGPRDAAPRPAPPQRPFQSTGNSYADRLCGNANIVLLYNSPKHTSYIITSYIFGAVFLIGGYNTAITIKEPKPPSNTDGGGEAAPVPPVPRYLRYSLAFGAVMFIVMGSAFILAPTKMIRRVWLVKPQPQSQPRQQQFGASYTPPTGYTFKIETRSPLLFRKGRTIETQTSNLSLDRVIRAQQDDLTWNSIPLKYSEAFTNLYLHRMDPSHPAPSLPTPPKRTIVSRLRSFNSSLLSAYPTLRAHARRMFLRDGIAYVYVIGESGQWKLDLRDCEVLDSARPIEHLIQAKAPTERKGLLPFLQGLMGSGGGKGM